MRAGDHMPPGDEPQVLRERAARLARPPLPAQAGDAAALEFSVAGQPCLVELAWVREVRPLRALLPVPLVEGPVLGLAQLRSGMLPVLGIAQLLGAGSAPAEAPRQLLVLGRAAPVLAVAANIVGLVALEAPDAQRRGDALAEWRPDIVRGVTRQGRLVLDPERLLALPRTDPS
jgi:purine-binding chemotaxis protein CheW